MKIMNDNLKGEEFYQFLLSAFKNAYENLADGAAIYIFHSDAEKVNFYNAVVAAGFHYSTTCIWVKQSLVLGRFDYQMRHEPVIYAFKDTVKHKFYGDRKQTTVWEFDRPSKSKLHPETAPDNETAPAHRIPHEKLLAGQQHRLGFVRRQRIDPDGSRADGSHGISDGT